ncbi:hypothetical protein Btru_021277, partial [Bulinus truncatus]
MDTVIPVQYLGSEYVVFSNSIVFGSFTMKFVAAFEWTSIAIYYPYTVKNITLKAVGDSYEKIGSSGVTIDRIALFLRHLIILKWIFGSLYVIVRFSLNKDVDKYFHFQLTDKVKPFGAYVYGSNSNSIFCHPLGFSHPVEQANTEFGHQSFVDQLMPQPTVQPQVTCGVEETTTSYQTDSTTFVPSGSTNSTYLTVEHTTTADSELTTTVEHSMVTTAATTENKTSDGIVSDITESTASPTSEISTSETTRTSLIETSNSIVTDTSYFTSTEAADDETDITQTSVTIDHSFYFSSTTFKIYGDIDLSDLIVNVKNTSAYRRSLISIPDPRLSSQMIGGFGIIITISVF